MKIVMQNAGVVDARHQAAELHRHGLAQTGCTRLGQLGQDRGEEVVQRDAIFQALRDENAFRFGADARFLLGEGPAGEVKMMGMPRWAAALTMSKLDARLLGRSSCLTHLRCADLARGCA